MNNEKYKRTKIKTTKIDPKSIAKKAKYAFFHLFVLLRVYSRSGKGVLISYTTYSFSLSVMLGVMVILRESVQSQIIKYFEDKIVNTLN